MYVMYLHVYTYIVMHEQCSVWYVCIHLRSYIRFVYSVYVSSLEFAVYVQNACLSESRVTV